MSMKNLPDFGAELRRDLEDNQRMAHALTALASLLADHPTPAQLAAHLIDVSGGDWKVALEWLTGLRKAIDSDLRLLRLTVALEGKEREQQSINPQP